MSSEQPATTRTVAPANAPLWATILLAFIAIAGPIIVALIQKQSSNEAAESVTQRINKINEEIKSVGSSAAPPLTSSAVENPTGQKFCQFIGNHWRDTISVPGSWDRNNCVKFGKDHDDELKIIGCFFSDSYSQEDPAGQPRPDCGWGRP